MPRPAIALLDPLDEAFEGRGIEESNESQALLTNLASLTDAEWHATVPRAYRLLNRDPRPTDSPVLLRPMAGDIDDR